MTYLTAALDDIEPEGLRYHPRFREFLLSLLDREPAAKRALLVRDARRLRDEGQVCGSSTRRATRSS